MPIIVRVAALVIALTFGWAAGAKLIRFGTWREATGGYRLPGVVAGPARVAVPALEAAVAALVIAGRLRLGAGLALACLALFSLAIARAHVQGSDRLPCGCFGGTATRDARLLLLRNASLAVPVGVILVHGRDHDVFEGFAAPTSGEAVAALSVLVGIFLVGWILYQANSSLRHRERA